MRLSNYCSLVIVLLFYSLSLSANSNNIKSGNIESDTAKFMAKDKENTLKIINYQKDLESKLKKEAEEKLKKQQEAELKRKLLQQNKSKAQLQKALQKETAERRKQELLAKQQKEQAEKLALEEAKRNRISPIKVVNNQVIDRVSLKKNNEYYLNNYTELGVPEDITSSVVSREHIITTDMYIRLLTETNINSRRGGEFVAVVERDVYSLESDIKEVLLPKGSKIICDFQPLSAYGETALKAGCKRIYFPNGKSIILSAGALKDQMGRNGIVGKVDNRVWERYGTTFTMAVLSGLGIMGADKVPNSNVGSLAQYTALSMLDLSTQILEKTIDLSPVVTIASGARIIFKPEIDINLKPEIEEVAIEEADNKKN